MKKFLVIVLLIAGCATTYPPYNGPPEYTERFREAVRKVCPCFSSDCNYELLISYTEEVFAMSEAPNRIFLSYGQLKAPDDDLIFTLAHEMAHLHLGHHAQVKTVSGITTGAMIAANFVVPGVGLINHAVNPAVSNNFTKTKELEADKKAVEVMENCLHIPHERIIKLFESYRNCSGGGFWSTHPSWDDRIENISKPE